MPQVSVIIVSYNTQDMVTQCLQSLEDHGDVSYEVILVENHPRGDVSRVQEAFSYITVVYNSENTGFGGGNNVGVSYAKGAYLLCLNPDTRVQSGQLSRLVHILQEDPQIGSIGCALMQTTSTLQPHQYGQTLTVRNLLTQSFAFPQEACSPSQIPEWHSVEWHSGGAFICRKEVFEDVGGFDERFFLYFEDMDLCARLRMNGYACYWTSYVQIYHEEGGTQAQTLRMKRRYYASQRTYMRTYRGILQAWLLMPLHLIKLGYMYITQSRSD
ncbi:MAG: glycosyltransferase family 2 protein [Candidatus Paceibacteria bacterium]